MCQALLEVATTGYPSPASIDYLRSNSVASYLADVRVPTLIGQGQADTLFNLQESVATYTALREQGTPVSLVWQSWGHSDSSPVAGELDLRHPADSYEGRQALAWFDHYVRGTGHRAGTGLPLLPRLGVPGQRGRAAASTRPTPSRRASRSTSARTWYLSGGQTVPGVGGAVLGDPAALTPGGGALVADGTATGGAANRRRSGRTTARPPRSTRPGRWPTRRGRPSASPALRCRPRWTSSDRRGSPCGWTRHRAAAQARHRRATGGLRQALRRRAGRLRWSCRTG